MIVRARTSSRTATKCLIIREEIRDGNVRWVARRDRRCRHGVGGQRHHYEAWRRAGRRERIRTKRSRRDGQVLGGHRTKSTNLARRRATDAWPRPAAAAFREVWIVGIGTGAETL